jgi:hypothetical protein
VEDHGLAVQQHLAAVGTVHPGQRLDQRRLSGAVLSGESVGLTGEELQRDVS